MQCSLRTDLEGSHFIMCKHVSLDPSKTEDAVLLTSVTGVSAESSDQRADMQLRQSSHSLFRKTHEGVREDDLTCRSRP